MRSIQDKNQITSEPIKEGNAALVLNENEIWEYDKNGIHFGHEGFWQVSDFIDDEIKLVRVTCENRTNHLEQFLILKADMAVNPQEFIDGIINELKEIEVYEKAIFLPSLLVNSDTLSARYFNLRPTINDEGKAAIVKDYFGEIKSFNQGDLTILIIKQSNQEKRLNTAFRTIEENLEFTVND